MFYNLLFALNKQHNLNQGLTQLLATGEIWLKHGLFFVNEKLLKHGCCHSFTRCLWWLLHCNWELRGCERHSIDNSVKKILNLCPSKNVFMPGLNHHFLFLGRYEEAAACCNGENVKSFLYVSNFNFFTYRKMIG